MSKLSEFFKDLPDGPFWVTGKLLKAFAGLLDKDRARLAPTSGSEVPTPHGRFFITNGGASSSSCPLGLYDATDKDGPKIGIQWGTIQGRQPADFAAGGDPPFVQSVSGSGYVYANATFDLTTLQATGAQAFFSTNPFLTNTTTDIYAMMGSYTVAGDSKSVTVTTACGPYTFDPCDLVPS